MKISELKRTTFFLSGSLQEVKDRAVQTEMDLSNDRKTSAVSDSLEEVKG